ncbi:MAG: glycoside hydrolase family 97 protein [Gemmatimonadaceae bacterium]
MFSRIAGALGFCVFASIAPAQTISSPSGTLSLSFTLSTDGEPAYALARGTRPVIEPSRLGVLLKDAPSFDAGFVVLRVDTTSVDETWTPVWGETRTIRNHYRELAVTLGQRTDSSRRLIIRFRVFDDGLGFRYEFPAQRGLTHFVVAGERTEFDLTGNHKVFYIPGDYDTNEYRYNTTTLSTIDGWGGRDVTEIVARSPISGDAVQTPLMMKSADGLYINIHEAALVNYPAMNLEIDRPTFRFTSRLVPDAVGNAAYLRTPAHTPWRTIIVSDKATDILASRIVLNLNEPSAIKDPSFIKPTKFVGVWWEMHVGKATWDYAGAGNFDPDVTKLKPTGKHGATTARVKTYIDFAAKHKIGGVLVEGWNAGWEDWFGQWKEDVFDFVTPYPDFDIAALSAYAKQKGVALIMHHETSSSVTNYERRMDRAYAFMTRYGYTAVKTGYVGKIIPRGEHHDGQWMVNHYARVAAATAERRLMLDAHEPVRPTGLQRTYPNWMASEAARGNEFNAGAIGNPPEHETILPFTRLIGGPMDYTPGIFEIKLDHWIPGKPARLHTTLAKQLALYVTMYSPLQMAADLPESYNQHLDAFRFIEDVAVDWDDTRYLEAEPGDYLTVARKAKGTSNWYVGAITDEHARTATVPLSFLDAGRYVATIYADAADADWERNPVAYRISSQVVTRDSVLSVALANGGGAAVSIHPVARGAGVR